MSEEEFGVNLGMAAMKYELLTPKFDLSENVKAKLDTALQNFAEYQINSANQELERIKNDPLIRTQLPYAPLSHDNIAGMIKRMQDNLNSGDINKAFSEDMKTVAKLYKSKATDFYAWNYFNRSEESKEMLGISTDISFGKRPDAPYLEKLTMGELQNVYFGLMGNTLAGDWNQIVKRLNLNEDVSSLMLHQNFSAIDINI